MATSREFSKLILLCPLQFERRALVAAGLEECCDIVCCGPGDAAGIWVKDNCATNTNSLLILAGLGGGLRDSLLASTAHIASKVIDEQGNSWTPTFKLSEKASQATIVSTKHVIVTPEGKRALAERSGADIVDLESAGFAAAASVNTCHWAIVRGISDCVDDSLPEDIDQWVDSKGSTKPSAVVASILRKPALLGDIRKMRSASITAMQAVSDIIKLMMKSK
ncbi:MAG: hypothetical protein IH984_14165 [Planctomycetes bacterium]|nr:hypothetical protein [Planctomycetota bacterium]